MRVFVTGGAGFIGSNLVRMLVQRGHHVLNYDKLTYAGNRQSLRDLDVSTRHRFVIGDVCDTSAISSELNAFRPDWIMHLAAESHVDRSIDAPGQFIQTNIVGTFSLLRATTDYWCQLSANEKQQFRVLHVSTDEVYGSLGDQGLFTEETRYDPHSPYSASKASSDHLVRAWYHTYGLPVLVTNCSNNYGPYQFPEKLIPVVILNAIQGKPIPVYGKGQNVRDWLFVEDHCDALITVIAEGKIGETYNIGGNNELRNIDLVNLLCKLIDELAPESANRPAKTAELITYVSDRPGHDLRYAIDASKLSEQLDWRPKQDRNGGFRRTVQWYLENRDWWQAVLNGTYQN